MPRPVLRSGSDQLVSEQPMPRPVLRNGSDQLVSELEAGSMAICRFKQKMKALKKEKEDQKEEMEKEKYRQSKIYSVLKPALGLELSKAHSSKTPLYCKILRLYTLPSYVSKIYWEKIAEILLGKEDESLWVEKVKEVKRKGINSSFYKSAAEWLIQKTMEKGGEPSHVFPELGFLGAYFDR